MTFSNSLTTGSSPIDTVRRLYSSKLFMLLLLIVTIAFFLWNNALVLHYPAYDESGYFFRAVNLVQGNFEIADIFDIKTTPLQVLHYAFWYALLRTSDLYPIIFVTTILLLGLGAYVLLSRILHPAIAWLLSIAIAIAVTPSIPTNVNYYFGPAILWCGLGLLDKNRLYSRAAGVFLTFLACYVRPEFILVAGFISVVVFIYEWRQIRSGLVSRKAAYLVYLPVLLILIVTAYLWRPDGQSNYRAMRAFSWSYVDYIRRVEPERFKGAVSWGDAGAWEITEQDFGTSQSLPQMILYNPGRFAQYLQFNLEQYRECLGTGLIDWRITDNSFALCKPSPYLYYFDLGLVIIFGLGLFGYYKLRSQGGLNTVPIVKDPLALIGFASLALLLPTILLLSTWARFYHIFPLILLPVGLLLSYIASYWRLSPWLISLAIVANFFFIPKVSLEVLGSLPLNSVLASKPSRDFVRTYVPSGATLLSTTAWTYRNYLYSEGKIIYPIDTVEFTEKVLIQAHEKYPMLEYFLVTKDNSPGDYQQWFTEWDNQYLHSPWRIIAQDAKNGLELYYLDTKNMPTEP
jgi:hypothetical protein